MQRLSAVLWTSSLTTLLILGYSKMLEQKNLETGVLERLCPVAGSMGEWMAIIDGKAYLTWPGTAEGLRGDDRCRDLGKGTRVEYDLDDKPTSLSTGRRAGTYTGPPTIKFMSFAEA